MEKHLEKLKKLLEKLKLDAALITNTYDIAYFTGFSNFSSEEREAYLLVAKKKAYIITDGRYDEAVTKETTNFEVLTRSVDNSLYAILSEIAKKDSLTTVGFDEYNLTVSEYVKLWDVFEKLIPFSAKKLRVKKDPTEIAKIKKSCELGDKAFTFISKHLKEEVTEKQIATELEFFIKKHGADISFSPIVAFGKNASVPHHQTGNTKLKKGDFVLLDFGIKYENYCSDMTRTIVFGKASDKQKKMYETVLAAQKSAIDLLNFPYKIQNTSGKTVRAADLDKTARDYILSKGFPTIPHSLGHGIGLEVHESPSLSPASKEQLDEGMVFSIEPGIYIPNFGGVRIEDLYTIQNGKLQQLTQSPNKTLITIA